jgi:hypothetical protein
MGARVREGWVEAVLAGVMEGALRGRIRWPAPPEAAGVGGGVVVAGGGNVCGRRRRHGIFMPVLEEGGVSEGGGCGRGASRWR